MRTTIDMPDALYRKTKAVAALRGSSMKDVIIQAVEHELKENGSMEVKPKRVKLPLIHGTTGRKLDLSNFDFDELLG